MKSHSAMITGTTNVLNYLLFIVVCNNHQTNRKHKSFYPSATKNPSPMLDEGYTSIQCGVNLYIILVFAKILIPMVDERIEGCH